MRTRAPPRSLCGVWRDRSLPVHATLRSDNVTGRVGVAISTTGTRADMLAAAVDAWRGTGIEPLVTPDLSRRGVASCKNFGIAELMHAGVEHIFLADDDMYPLQRFSWTRMVDDPALHLSLSWGKHRRKPEQTLPGYTEYTWPRGVLLYFHRSVIDKVGGYREDYGVAHEHADISRRIFQAGLTERMFLDLDHDAAEWFHCEDAQRPGETIRQLQSRRRRITTIKRTAADVRRIQELWRKYDGNTDYVPYR